MKKLEGNDFDIFRSKVVFISDMHLGCKDNADESMQVQHLIFYALQRYLQRGFTVVLLGDTFELAENRDIEKIKNAHDDIMWVLGELYAKNQLVVVRGNHDKYLTSDQLQTRQSQYDGTELSWMPACPVYDYVTVRDFDDPRKNIIIAEHGHRYSWIFNSWFNKILIWLGPLWKKWQLLFKDGSIAEATTWEESNKVLDCFRKEARREGAHFVIGHTHKCFFKQGDVVTNCGSFGTMPRCITATEFRKEDRTLTTVKWSEVVRPGVDPTAGAVYIDCTTLGVQNI